MRDIVAQTEAEGLFYKILADMYGPPQKEVFEGHVVALRFIAAALGIPRLGEPLQEMANSLAELEDEAELAAEYVRLFRGPMKPVIYPYESMYLDGEIMGPTALAVMERYREAGLGLAEDHGDLPDHICTELEFMYFLAFLNAENRRGAERGKSSSVRRRRKAFRTEHIERWVPRLAQDLMASTACPFYRGLAYVTLAFLRLSMGAPAKGGV